MWNIKRKTRNKKKIRKNNKTWTIKKEKKYYGSLYWEEEEVLLLKKLYTEQYHSNEIIGYHAITMAINRKFHNARSVGAIKSKLRKILNSGWHPWYSQKSYERIKHSDTELKVLSSHNKKAWDSNECSNWEI